MLKFDENTLDELGLADLPADEKRKLLLHVRETLEKRVGMTLVKQMTDAQLKEFEVFMANKDQDGARKWLDANVPQYKQVVHDELDQLKKEIHSSAPEILRSLSDDEA